VFLFDSGFFGSACLPLAGEEVKKGNDDYRRKEFIHESGFVTTASIDLVDNGRRFNIVSD
jgi:hypothetical protein